MPVRSILLALLCLASAACRSGDGGTSGTATPKPIASTPPLFPERSAVLEAIEAGRLQDAEATLRSAEPSADVRYLRAKIALARQDAETAYQEIRKAVEDAPAFAEYQYELGVIAPLPVSGLSDAQLEGRLRIAGLALLKAVTLAPHEPRYQYAFAFFLSSAPPQDGGNPSDGKKRFDEILIRHADSVWAHRVLFDRAAEREDLETAEAEAAKAGALDATEGSRLFLLAAGSRMIQGNLEKARQDLESAVALKRSASAGFCDAGQALDGGGNPRLAEPFWKRCLELDPGGVKGAQARSRLGTH